MIGQRLQSLRALEQGARAVLGTGRKFRSPKVAHHERVSRQDEPWLIRAGSISDQKRNMLRRVSRSMQDRDQDISELEGVAVSHTAEWKFHLRISEQHVLCAGGGCEDATRRNVISMN